MGTQQLEANGTVEAVSAFAYPAISSGAPSRGGARFGRFCVSSFGMSVDGVSSHFGRCAFTVAAIAISDAGGPQRTLFHVQFA
jgi:hypothetical protein